MWPPLVVLLSTAILAGCYSYEPTDVGSVAPAEELRVRVRPLEDPTGLGNPSVRSLEGSLLEMAGDTLVIGKVREFWAGSANYQAGRQAVRLPRDRILSLERKRLSTWKTAALAGGTVAAAAILLLTLEGDGDGGGGPDGPGPGPDVSVGVPMSIPVP